MKRSESTSSPQVLKKTQPEEFDLVILGGGAGEQQVPHRAFRPVRNDIPKRRRKGGLMSG
jgi:hypothetical protein